MRKMLALIALVVGMGSLAMTDAPFANAQDVKTTKKTDAKTDTKPEPKKADTKKTDTKAETGAGTIEIYKAKDGYRFRIKDADGKVAAMPVKGHETIKEVEQTLEFLKTTLGKVKPTVVKD